MNSTAAHRTCTHFTSVAPHALADACIINAECYQWRHQPSRAGRASLQEDRMSAEITPRTLSPPHSAPSVYISHWIYTKLRIGCWTVEIQLLLSTHSRSWWHY